MIGLLIFCLTLYAIKADDTETTQQFCFDNKDLVKEYKDSVEKCMLIHASEPDEVRHDHVFRCVLKEKRSMDENGKLNFDIFSENIINFAQVKKEEIKSELKKCQETLKDEEITGFFACVGVALETLCPDSHSLDIVPLENGEEKEKPEH